MIEELSTTTFKSGWSRMERVLFLLNLLLVICLLTTCSVFVLILFGDIELPIRKSTPPSATKNDSFTVKPTVAMSTTKLESQTSGTMPITRPEYNTTEQKVTTATTKTTTMTTSSPETLKLCETRGCIVAAARLLQSMNKSVNPCDNFYQYACGSWIQSHPVKPQDIVSIFREDIEDKTERLTELLSSSDEREEIDAVVKIKKAYMSCTSESYIKQKSIWNVDYLIKTAGGMPLVDLNWTMDQSLEDFLIGLRKNFGIMPLLPVTVKTDAKNTSRNIIHIGSGNVVSDSSLVSPKPYGARMSDALYDQLVTIILKQFHLSRKTVDKQIAEVGKFQQKFGAVKWQTKVNQDKLEEIYNPTTLDKLQANYTTFDWKYFLEGLLSMNGSNVTLPSNEPLIIESPSYIARLMALMNETRNRAIVNYAILSTIMHYKDPLGIDSRSLYSLKKDKKSSRLHYDVEEDRTTSCVDVFIENCNHVLGWMYIQKYFNDDQVKATESVTQMTKFTKNAVEEILEATPWLGPKSKQYGLSKIQDLLKIIGYNNETMTAKNVNRLFDGLQISRWNYFRNMMQIKARQMVLQLSILGMPTSRTGSDGDGMFAVNAWYDAQVNAISIPAGIIRNPFFDMHSPMSLNFGSLGTIVGHELMHAYDDEGSLYDSKGNYFPWLSPDDKKKFSAFSEGLVKQYSSFNIPNTDLYVNGNRTLGENIADNGGLKVTYQGYVAWEKSNRNNDYRLPGLKLNHHQLFFLSFAQTWCANVSPDAYEYQIENDAHAPAVARVLLTLRNSKEFSTVYGCPQGSEMNPSKKYGVW